MFLGVISSRRSSGRAAATPAVAQGHGDGALGLVVADDEAVQFGNDFAGGKLSHPSQIGDLEGSGTLRGAKDLAEHHTSSPSALLPDMHIPFPCGAPSRTQSALP
jgi:hypothetical protein